MHMLIERGSPPHDGWCFASQSGDGEQRRLRLGCHRLITPWSPSLVLWNLLVWVLQQEEGFVLVGHFVCVVRIWTFIVFSSSAPV